MKLQLQEQKKVARRISRQKRTQEKDALRREILEMRDKLEYLKSGPSVTEVRVNNGSKSEFYFILPVKTSGNVDAEVINDGAVTITRTVYIRGNYPISSAAAPSREVQVSGGQKVLFSYYRPGEFRKC